MDFRKTFIGFCIFALFLIVGLSAVFGVGTVTDTDIEVVPRSGVRVLTFNWTADAADGSVPNAVSTENVNGFVFQVAAIPGNASNPTDQYDITLEDGDGVDIMASALINNGSDTTKVASPVINGTTMQRFVDGKLTLKVSGNSVNEASGTLKVYYKIYP